LKRYAVNRTAEGCAAEQLDEIVVGNADAKAARAERFTSSISRKRRKPIKLKLDKLNDQSRKDDLVTFEGWALTAFLW
jgi:hypothetical protein